MARYNGNIMVYYEYDDPFIGRIGDFWPVQGMRDREYYSYSGQTAWHNLGTEDATSAWEPQTSTVSGKGIYLQMYHNGQWKRITKYQVRHDEYVEYIGNRISLLPHNGYNFGKNIKLRARLEVFHILPGTTTNQNLFYTGEGNPEQLSNYYFRIYYNASSSRFILDRKIGSQQYTFTIPVDIIQGQNYNLTLFYNLDAESVVGLDSYTWNEAEWRWDYERLYNGVWNPWGSNYGYTSSTTNAYVGDSRVRFLILIQVTGANSNDTGDGGHFSIMKTGWPTGNFEQTPFDGTVIVPTGNNVTDNATYSGLKNFKGTESTYTWE